MVSKRKLIIWMYDHTMIRYDMMCELTCGKAGNAWKPDMMEPTRKEKAAWVGSSSQCWSAPYGDKRERGEGEGKGGGRRQR
jgi:hypothetical protein